MKKGYGALMFLNYLECVSLNKIQFNMKIDIKWILLIVVVAILGFTNPNKEEHIDEIVHLVTQDALEEIGSEGDTYGLLGATMGLGIVRNLTENLIDTNNYILFSYSKV